MLTIFTITHRADFLAASQSTHKSTKPSVIIQCRTRGVSDVAFADSVRAGFTATRKLGNAVVRNRVKRRLRAAAFQLLPELGTPGHDYVFIGRSQTCRGSFDSLISDMKHALKRLAGSASTPPSTASEKL